MDRLREQLESLNAQTYPNIELIVRDGLLPDHIFQRYLRAAEKYDYELCL
jgi:glycosyltransferase involved in cell wall biosynthesis